MSENASDSKVTRATGTRGEGKTQTFYKRAATTALTDALEPEERHSIYLPPLFAALHFV